MYRLGVLRARLEVSGQQLFFAGDRLEGLLLGFALNYLIVGLEISLFAGVSGARISCLTPQLSPVSPPPPPTPIHLIKPRVNERLPCITYAVGQTGSSCLQRGLGIGKDIRCVYK